MTSMPCRPSLPSMPSTFSRDVEILARARYQIYGGVRVAKLMPITNHCSEADVLVNGRPVVIGSAPEWHIVLALRAWTDVSVLHGITWESLATDMDSRFPPHVWAPCHREKSCLATGQCYEWPCLKGRCMADPTILGILDALSKVGIWVSLSDDETLIIGPEKAVADHPDLLVLVRSHKPAVIHAIKSMQAYAFFGRDTDDSRFETATCLECSQEVYVIASPRRLSVHRLIDGKTVCPGSERAQLATAEALLTAFIIDRCVPRPGAILTWTSLRAALLAWCAAREFWLPPPQYLQQWLGEHYTVGTMGGKQNPLGPVYEGLSLKQEEWLGDDEDIKAAAQQVQAAARAAVAAPPKKAKLVATGKAPTPAVVEELWPTLVQRNA